MLNPRTGRVELEKGTRAPEAKSPPAPITVARSFLFPEDLLPLWDKINKLQNQLDNLTQEVASLKQQRNALKEIEPETPTKTTRGRKSK